MLDTRIHQVEFAGGEVTELTTNVITELMYTQFNADVNKYLLLDMLVDHQKGNKTTSLSNQQTTVWGRPVTCKTPAGWQICCQWKDDSTVRKCIKTMPISPDIGIVIMHILTKVHHKPQNVHGFVNYPRV